MTVLVDTSVWSFAYRRAKRSPLEEAIVDELIQLIRRERAVLIGAVRQEVLSGIRDATHFERVRLTLRGFGALRIATEEFERAAELHNLCRRKGVQGSSTDFLICAVALRYDAPIFTTDRDFRRYAKLTGVRLHGLKV
jgi:predicted nucleic acid-binding protein